MVRSEMAHLELLAEMDALGDSLKRWADDAPDWQPAKTCHALVRRLEDRAGSMRIRLEAPLVVATLGGTGTGKSALISALVGENVTQSGRSRPTTMQPVLISRPDISPQMLGIPPESVETVHRDLPALADLVLIDCPDPDTTEDPDARASNLSRLRDLLPHCDVLLITTTQQKYRSSRVSRELAAAAGGARLVFVQTHADVDEDIRKDWRQALQDQYTAGHIFFVDSPAALSDAREGLEPRGEFAGLADLLTRELAGTAAARIRRANFLDLVDETLALCRTRIDEGLPKVARLDEAILQQRTKLGSKLAGQMRTELLASRRQWENRLLGRVASRWGFSPFALVLRIFQGLGGLASGALLMRARSPAQVALWGAFEGVRGLRKHRGRKRAEASADRAVAGCWDDAELREAALVIDGYTAEAGFNHAATDPKTVAAEANDAGQTFVGRVADELEALIGRAASRHTGWFTRFRYELSLAVILVLLSVRPAKNFFYDSWLADPLQPVLGLDFYLVSALWLLAWCGLLLWGFTSRLRRGLRREINQLADAWQTAQPADGIFAQLESDCRQVERFSQELNRLRQRVSTLRGRLSLPDDQLGHRVD
jgi:hypothetical protein